MINFDRLEKLDKEYKENRYELICISIAFVSFIAMLIGSIILREIAMIVICGVGVGFLTAALIVTIVYLNESREVYLKEKTRVLEELHRETRKMLFNAIVELDKAISFDIAKRKAEQEKAKAEAEKPKAKAKTKTIKKKN